MDIKCGHSGGNGFKFRWIIATHDNWKNKILRAVLPPRILMFSIVMGANYSSELISMPNWVPAIYAHNNFCLDKVVKN